MTSVLIIMISEPIASKLFYVFHSMCFLSSIIWCELSSISLMLCILFFQMVASFNLKLMLIFIYPWFLKHINIHVFLTLPVLGMLWYLLCVETLPLILLRLSRILVLDAVDTYPFFFCLVIALSLLFFFFPKTTTHFTKVFSDS